MKGSQPRKRILWIGKDLRDSSEQGNPVGDPQAGLDAFFVCFFALERFCPTIPQNEYSKSIIVGCIPLLGELGLLSLGAFP